MPAMILRIKGLRLRAIVGVNSWEREERQAVILNAEIEFVWAGTDDMSSTLDYREVTKRIIALVEGSSFFLLETLAQTTLDEIMRFPQVLQGRVEIDKPKALRSADSTSIEASARRAQVSAAVDE